MYVSLINIAESATSFSPVEYVQLTLQQSHPESDKAVRYISQLDEARCAGRWKDVPELCRKVEKHAPHRRCQQSHTARVVMSNCLPRSYAYGAIRGADICLQHPAALYHRFNSVLRPLEDNTVAAHSHRRRRGLSPGCVPGDRMPGMAALCSRRAWPSSCETAKGLCCSCRENVRPRIRAQRLVASLCSQGRFFKR